jgi:hypothetical protein
VRLETPLLRNRHEEVLKRTFDADFVDAATEIELKALKDAFLSRNEEGKLQSFAHVLARYAAQRLGDSADGPAI